MILGIDIPTGASVSVENGKIIIVFDEKETKHDLWKMSVVMWLTDGKHSSEFWSNNTLSSKRLEVSNRNKISLISTK